MVPNPTQAAKPSPLLNRQKTQKPDPV